MKRKNTSNTFNSSSFGITSVSVGIPVHNEEKNIANLLGQIINQKRKIFVLEEIIVILDGCNDNSEKIIREYAKNNPVIVIICDGRRLGKSQRLNQLYEMNKSEILITLDGDVMLQDDFVFENLLSEFIDQSIVVVGGNVRPLPGKTFLEKVIVAKDKWWYEARKDFNGGNNIYNSAGPCFALRNEFAKKITYFPDTINDQEVIFLKVLESNNRFAFADNAIVRIREASNWSEHVARAKRFEYDQNLAQYGFTLNIDELYRIPIFNKAKAAVKVIFSNPFYGVASIVLAIIVNKLQFKKLKKNNLLSSGIWETSNSTKDL